MVPDDPLDNFLEDAKVPDDPFDSFPKLYEFTNWKHKSTKWAKKTFERWKEQEGAKAPDDLLENPPNPSEMDRWLSLFINEVRSLKGKEYSPMTIEALLVGLQRHIQSSKPSYPALSKQSDFPQLHSTKKRLFEELRQKEVGTSSKAKLLTSEDEKQQGYLFGKY